MYFSNTTTKNVKLIEIIIIRNDGRGKELGIYKNLSGQKRGSQIKHTHTQYTIHYINVFLTNFTYYDNMFSV